MSLAKKSNASRLSSGLLFALAVLPWPGTSRAHPTGSEVLHHSGPARNRIDMAITFYGFQNDQA